MELLKLLSANELVAQIISFLLVLWLLRVFLWKRLLKLLDDRKEKIASELKTIEDTQAETSRIKADYETKITEIDKEAAKRIQKAKEEAQKAAEGIRKKAEEEAEIIVANGKADIQDELIKAKEQLKTELVDITIKATENIIGEKFTENQDKKIIEDFLEDIDKI